MKLQNMFKKNRKSYIPLKSERPEVPEGLLKKCNKCGAAILTEEVKSAGYICPKCQGYFRVHAYERIRMTVDEDSFEEWEKDMEFVNPLEFRGYEEKVKSLKEKTGLSEAVVTGKASIEGNPAVIAVCDGRFLMIEQCREIVHKFNSVYGEALVMPKALIPENESCCRLPGTDGKAKMSKSLGNCIYLSDSEEEVRQKIMGMYTDPNHLKVSDPGQVEGNSVFTYLDAFCTDEHFEKYLPDYKNLDELKDHYRRGGLGDVKVKKFLNAVMQEELAPIRARRKELEKKIPEIYEILHKGSIEAEKVAAQTLKEVKDAMKINYFEDQQLIREQTARFAE